MPAYTGGGPSVAQIAAQAGMQGTPADIGLNEAAKHHAIKLGHEQRYAPPAQPYVPDPADAALVNNAYINFDEKNPMKYTIPTEGKKRMVARQAIRDTVNVPGGASQVIDTVQPEEVDYLMTMQDQVELAKFDTWVGTKYSRDDPATFKWMMEVYPNWVHRQVQQIQTDYEFAMRSDMIDSYGVNSFEDLVFLYHRDQRNIDGPRLTQTMTPQYHSGWLSPWAFLKGAQPLLAPFSSAARGNRPDENSVNTSDDWKFNGRAPLGAGGDLDQLAASIYAKPTPGGDGSYAGGGPGGLRPAFAAAAGRVGRRG